MIKVFNLATGDEMSFDCKTTPMWAVAYAYCEEHNLMSGLFRSAQENTFRQFVKRLPFTRGQNSLACGDWAVVIEHTEKRAA